MSDLRHNIETSPLDSLSAAIGNIAQNDGDFTTAIGALSLHRRNTPTSPVHCIYQMGLGVVAQGAKQIMLAGKPTCYRAGESLLTAVDLPVVSHVTQASAEQPFLGLMLVLDPQTVAQMAAVIPPALAVREAPVTPLLVEPLDQALADALLRLVNLLAEPTLIAHVAPLIQQEIIVRLLTGPYSSQMRQMATKGTSGQQMMNKNLDASSAALFVGYESASQFSREYSREFGESPLRDIRRLRTEGES
ncbi:AraC family transcriptional regulator N-terminal domain-containing protein [Rahnella inusitata]|uniref:AraC family transcriptional regulator n=1 Tax=Rahnella inusitata TaxID=58169 RepID=UPI0039B02660